MKPRLALTSMHGLGDNIYQRAVVKHLVKKYDVYLDSPWPELYSDLPVNVLRPTSRYRTQAKNVARNRTWTPLPPGLQFKPWHYQNIEGSMLLALEQSAGVPVSKSIDFQGPPVKPVTQALPYVIVRPVTERREWFASSRNPYPEYIDRAARRAYAEGYEVISVADLAPNEEWLVGDEPFSNVQYHKGELDVTQLLSLVAGARGIIGGVGWALPAALAYRTPMLCVFGGCGGYNAPSRVLDARIDCRRIVQALPTNFCMCKDMKHACDKRIDLEPYLEQYFKLILRAKPAMAS